MKKIIYSALVVMSLVVLLFTLTGCSTGKKVDLTYKDEKSKVSVTFKVDEKLNYRLSEDKNEFRTSREKATLFGDTFSIGVEVYDDLVFEKYGGSFEKYMQEHINSDEYTEVTYNGMKGYSAYYGSYIRYEVYLPVKDSNKYFVKLTIYSLENKNSKDSVKAQYESDKVKDVLNNIEISIIE